MTASRARRASGLAGLVLLACAALLAVASPAVAAQPVGKLRLGHLSPSTHAVDAEIVGPEGPSSTSRRVASATYGTVTGYLDLAPGRYAIVMRPAGSDPSLPAPLSAGLDVGAGSAQSLFFFDSGPGGQPRGELVADDLAAPPAGEGKVRLVQAAGGTAPLQALAVDGPRLGTDLGYGTVTGYAPVGARTWDVRLSAGAVTAAAPLAVTAGSVTTVVVTRNAAGALAVTPLTDVAGRPAAGATGPAGAASTPAGAAAPPRQVPQGGVPAGAGGTAPGGSALPLVLALAGAPLLVLGLTAARSRRRGA
ncbi:DUF4397 domain-containing protein [Pseudonocardia spirodelae]|uniref:DUF4397 domain-containing protein n=1 Tax=Pseudonocardia spirodelae TaxID=3133431 RepID=A0ABU8T3J5_9PSEU